MHYALNRLAPLAQLVRSPAGECVEGQPAKRALRPEASNFLRPENILAESQEKLNKRNAPLAQLVEQLTLNQWVPGSSP